MHFPLISFVVGAGLSIIPIALGVVAVATRIWLRIKRNSDGVIVATYSLFDVSSVGDFDEFDYPASQGLIIAGIIAIAIGVVITLFLDVFIKNRWIHLFPGVFLYAGPTLIFIGLLLYAKSVFENVSGNATTLVLGYSIVLAIIACLLGFFIAIYFAFFAGSCRSHNRVIERSFPSPPVIYDEIERF